MGVVKRPLGDAPPFVERIGRPDIGSTSADGISGSQDIGPQAPRGPWSRKKLRFLHHWYKPSPLRQRG